MGGLPEQEIFKVFVTREIPQAGIKRIREFAEVDVWQGMLPPGRDELLERVGGCHGLITLLSDRVDAELIEHAGLQLRVISNYAVGVNNIDLEAARLRGIAVGNTPDVLTDATADTALALLLAAARRLPEAIDNVRQGNWKTWEPKGFLGVDLVGRTVGIVGMGRIGFAVAKRLHFGWGMQVLYTSRTPKPRADQELGAKRVSLTDLLKGSDFVSLHCPLTSETRDSINTKRLALMRDHAVLVNTARGEILDQDALYEALRNRRIFAAGLDVTTPEPLPTNHPLASLPNCVIAPHIGSASFDSRNAMALIAAENLIAGLTRQPLPHPV